MYKHNKGKTARAYCTSLRFLRHVFSAKVETVCFNSTDYTNMKHVRKTASAAYCTRKTKYAGKCDTMFSS